MSTRKRREVTFSGDEEHLEVLNESLRQRSHRFWNHWRAQHSHTVPDLRGVILTGQALRGFDFRRVKLDGSNLRRADLAGVHMERASLVGADLRLADLSGVHAVKTNLSGAQLRSATLVRADFTDAICLDDTSFNHANLQNADFTRALMIKADLSEADLTDARFDDAKLMEASFENALLNGTSFLGANLREAGVWGAFIRRVKTDGRTDQRSLSVDVDVVWERRTGKIIEFTEADSIRLAQFHDIVEEHGSIADLIAASSKRVVLILGRFLPRRKRILDRLAEVLRARGKVAVVFDFPGPTDREISDTVRFIAGMSQFIVVDLTKASSVPMELQATIPDLMVPVIPIIQSGHAVFSMFADLQRRYSWIQSPMSYKNSDQLVKYVDTAIIGRAERAAEQIKERRNASVRAPVSVERVYREERNRRR